MVNWLGMAVLVISGFAGPAVAEARVVNFLNWADYLDEEILEQFHEETGIRVRYDYFDSNEVLETRLLAGGTGYDLVVPTNDFLARQIRAGVFQPLDKSSLPNLRHMWDIIRQNMVKYDPGNQYSVNYMWGTTGIGYNVEEVARRLPDAPVNSWDLVFRPENISKLADCGIYFVDAPTEILAAALHYLGRTPDSADPADLEAAEDLLMSIRPHIRKFHSSEYINALANGDICLVVGFSGDVLQARDRAAEAGNGVEIAYVIPDEGALLWFDQLAIPADAPDPEAAHLLIDFLLRPEIAARNTNFVNYASGNRAAQDLVDSAIRSDTGIYPDAHTMERLYTVRYYAPNEQRLVTRLWTRVKSGR